MFKVVILALTQLVIATRTVVQGNPMTSAEKVDAVDRYDDDEIEEESKPGFIASMGSAASSAASVAAAKYAQMQQMMGHSAHPGASQQSMMSYIPASLKTSVWNTVSGGLSTMGKHLSNTPTAGKLAMAAVVAGAGYHFLRRHMGKNTDDDDGEEVEEDDEDTGKK